MTIAEVRSIERRSKRRFSLTREVHYKLFDYERVETGAGKTLNISSGGVAFTCDRDLHAGALVELSISWPILLGETCPLKLIVFGRVLRSANRRVASTIEKYEFRTGPRNIGENLLFDRGDSSLRRWAKELAQSC